MLANGTMPAKQPPPRKTCEGRERSAPSHPERAGLTQRQPSEQIGLRAASPVLDGLLLATCPQATQATALAAGPRFADGL